MLTTSPQQNSLSVVPPLENGDRLPCDEFERRYRAMPHIKKAELIEGRVYMAAALRFNSHARPHGDLMGWLWTYKVATAGIELGDNPTVRLDGVNEPQPDAVLLIAPECGGQSWVSQDDYIEGAPELVIEVAASSAAYDLYEKKEAYRRNGVREYIVWQIFENQLDWFELQDGEYVSIAPDEAGILKSSIFPGLWLAVENLLTGNMTGVMAILQAGLATPEHRIFAERLTEDQG